MPSLVRVLLKLLAVAVALLFLVGAVLTAVTDLFGPGFALAAAPARDDGDAGVRVVDKTYFSASKSGPMPRPRARDAGEPVFFPASKSFGGESLPGVNQQLRELHQAEPAPQTKQSP